MTAQTSRFVVPAIGVVGLAAYVTVYALGLASPPIRSDGISYYVYLPAVVLHHDPTLAALADDCCGGRFPEYTGVTRVPGTRHWLNPHPIGMAILMAPFFLAAHGLTLWSNLPPDGFSPYYQHGAGLAGLAWALVGLWWLQRHLERRHSTAVAGATVLTIAFGTNLFHYATFDAVCSHAYAFALVTGLVALTARWFDQPTLRRSMALGLIAGLLVLVRHAHAIVLLYPILYGLSLHGAGLPRFALRQWSAVAAVCLTGALVLLPQLALYQAVSGSWLPNPYGQLDIGFDFWHPHLFGVLASPQKGLFFWSPILLLGLVGLFGATHPETRRQRWPVLAVLALLTWLVAGWGDWQLGGSYGHRGYTDLLALFALGIAPCYAWLARQRPGLRLSSGIFIAALIALSVFQMVQYWLGIVPFQDTTWEQYRALFLRLS